MNEQEQRIAIGKACGATWGHPVFNYDGKWHVHFDTDPFEFDSSWAGKPPPFEECEKDLDVPYFLDDLDAMHEAENYLKDEREYERLLKWVCDRDWQHAVVRMKRNPIYASAKQRAEAFLRSMKLWNEDTDPKALEGG